MTKNLTWLVIALAACTTMACSSFPISRTEQIYSKAANWPEASRLPDPGQAGAYTARNFLYAGDYNPRRPQYRGAAVAVRTATVDLSPFFTEEPARLLDNILRPAHYHDRIAKNYWGFDATTVPLNGTVWYPDGPGPFPLIVAVHGNHDPYDDSEFGYDYLGKHLASQGIIFASVDQNFLNGITDGRENDARAALLLYHLHELLRQSRDAGSPLFRLVDEQRLALMGHSRGGEAAVNAAIFNELGIWPDNAAVGFAPRLSIRAIIALAPVEGQYRPAQRELMVEKADFLYLHGSADGDVDVDFAARFLNRPGLAPGHFRLGFWIYGANHGYFNSDWSESTNEFPVPAAFRLTAEAQQQLCRVIVSAFLQVSFTIEPDYRSFLQDWRRGYHWLPQTVYTTRWRSGDDARLADFSEDADPRSATAPGWRISAAGFQRWYEGKLPAIGTGYIQAPELSERTIQTLHQDSHAVFLRGSDNQKGEYRLDGPAVSATGLRFDIGAHPRNKLTPDKAEQFLSPTIEVSLQDGQQLSYQLAELGSITVTPATFSLQRWSSRYYAPQTMQLVFPEPAELIGVRFILPADSDLEWHINHIMLIREGSQP